MNIVLVNLVIRHCGFALGPAVAYRNARIVCIRHFVVFNHDIARVASANAHGSLMFVGYVRNQVVTERIARADFVLVGRVIRNMNFSQGILRELAEHNAVRTDFVEHVAFDQVIVRTGDHVETVSSHLRKSAVPDFHVVSIFNTETCIRTPEEELVTTQAAIFFHHFDIEHAGLQIKESFFAGTEVIRMCEMQTIEFHVAHLGLGVFAKNAKERIDVRRDHICSAHIFAFAGLVINRSSRLV